MQGSPSTGRLAAALVASVALPLLTGCVGGDGGVGPDQEPRLTRIEVTPDSADLTAIGATQQYTATGIDQFGDPFPDVEFAWSSDDPSIVEVDDAGLATARDSGRALVQATAQGLGDAGVARVTIVRDDPATLEAVGGAGQHGITLHPYPDSLVVAARKENGDPATGVVVDFRVVGGTGSVSPASAATGVNGLARTQLVAGATTGPVTVEASAGDVDPVSFDATTTVLYVEIVDDAFVDPHGRLNDQATAALQLGRDTVLFEYAAGTGQHTVTSGEGPGGADGNGLPAAAGDSLASGTLEPGDRYRFVPDAEGTWTYFCEVHPDRMFGAELVVQAP